MISKKLVPFICVMLFILFIPQVVMAQIGDKPLFLEQNDITKEYIYVPSPFEIHFIFSLALENRFRETLICYRLGFGLCIDFFYIEIILDKEQESEKFGNYHRNWTSIRQLISKIERISYGVYNVTDIYAYIGEIYDFNAGFGTIIKNYTNANQSPAIEGVGAHISVDFGFITDKIRDFIRIEILTADLITPDLFAFSAYVKPLKLLNWGFYREVEIGATFAVDFNPYEISYYDREKEPWVNEFGTEPVIQERWTIYLNGTDPHIDHILGWSIYIKIPVYDFPFINFKLIFEYAVEEGLGQAFRFGVNGKLFWGAFNYRIEFIMYDRGFVPSLFNTQYENHKINRYIYGLNYKSNTLGDPFGVYIEIGKDIVPNRLGFTISFEDYFDDYIGSDPTNKIEGEITIRFYLKEFVKGLGIEILINKWNVGYRSTDEFFRDAPNNTMWYLKFYWWLTPNAQFSITSRHYFILYSTPIASFLGENSYIDKQHSFSIEALIYI